MHAQGRNFSWLRGLSLAHCARDCGSFVRLSPSAPNVNSNFLVLTGSFLGQFARNLEIITVEATRSSSRQKPKPDSHPASTRVEFAVVQDGYCGVVLARPLVFVLCFRAGCLAKERRKGWKMTRRPIEMRVCGADKSRFFGVGKASSWLASERANL